MSFILPGLCFHSSTDLPHCPGGFESEVLQHVYIKVCNGKDPLLPSLPGSEGGNSCLDVTAAWDKRTLGCGKLTMLNALQANGDGHY